MNKMKDTLASKIIAFNQNLDYNGELPDGFRALNPYLDNPETMQVMAAFYQKFYADNGPRKFLIGINPSRHGAGVTGVPFTDTKRLDSVCGIRMHSARTHEVSSVFLYDMIAAFGGATAFYREFYINSPFPLAIVRKTKSGDWLNANYYDEKSLFDAVKPFMIASLNAHLALGLDTEKVFVLGKKNAQYLQRINKEERLFGQMVVLEHPRYIQQYRSKDKQVFINKYLHAFGKIE